MQTVVTVTVAVKYAGQNWMMDENKVMMHS